VSCYSCGLIFLSLQQHSNPVRVAYVASLETQISSLRDELANLYKTQGQNAQRLLSMNETLREKEELSRIDSENLRKVKDEIAALRVKVGQHAELMAEKDRTIQVSQTQPFLYQSVTSKLLIEILHDEISTALLELGQVEDRNQTLTKDNAKLLQRWLDAKQVEANRMNEANEFYENMRSKHDTVLSWREGSGQDVVGSAPTSDSNFPLSGKGSGDHQAMGTMMKNGLLSPTSKAVDLTPNG
jgi:autophagy-related protein 16